MKSVKELAQETIDVLRKDGWKQGDYGTQDGPKCLVGAMRKASGYSDIHSLSGTRIDSIKILFRAVEKELNYIPIQNWNDAQGRTLKEVVELMERVIARN